MGGRILTNRFFVGLDIGQSHDFTALAVLDRPRVSPDSPAESRYPVYSLRHLQRFHLGTPYTEIVPGVVRLLQAPVLAGCTLVVDMTGVGRPVVDMLDQAMRGKLTCQRIAVTITGGQAVRSAGNGCVSVPKRELIAGLQVLLQTRRLQIARSLPEAEVLTKELENYRVKITAAGNEAFDCLIAGTMVETDKGPKPIELIKAGERVLTRGGYQNVRWSGRAKYVNKLTSVLLSSGKTITGTSDHLVWKCGYGWIPLGELRNHDELLSHTDVHQWASAIQAQGQLFSTESYTPNPQAIDIFTTAVGAEHRGHCTGRYGSFTTGRFPQSTTYTTKTEIQKTTLLKTWNASPKNSTDTYTFRGNQHKRRARLAALFFCAAECVAKKITKTGEYCPAQSLARTSIDPERLSASAFSARCNSLVDAPAFVFALPFAARLIGTEIENGRSRYAQNAAANSRQCTKYPSTVRVCAAAVTMPSDELVPVYDLMVDGDHEFVANGVLVHNSWRTNQNDDTVLATALAAWVGEQAIPKRAARGGPVQPKRIVAR